LKKNSVLHKKFGQSSKRQLWSILATDWLILLNIIHSTVLSPGDDKLKWTLGETSFYCQIFIQCFAEYACVQTLQEALGSEISC
jgi:hypothetical protein